MSPAELQAARFKQMASKAGLSAKDMRDSKLKYIDFQIKMYKFYQRTCADITATEIAFCLKMVGELEKVRQQTMFSG